MQLGNHGAASPISIENHLAAQREHFEQRDLRPQVQHAALLESRDFDDLLKLGRGQRAECSIAFDNPHESGQCVAAAQRFRRVVGQPEMRILQRMNDLVREDVQILTRRQIAVDQHNPPSALFIRRRVPRRSPANAKPLHDGSVPGWINVPQQAIQMPKRARLGMFGTQQQRAHRNAERLVRDDVNRRHRLQRQPPPRRRFLRHIPHPDQRLLRRRLGPLQYCSVPIELGNRFRIIKLFRAPLPLPLDAHRSERHPWAMRLSAIRPIRILPLQRRSL